MRHYLSLLIFLLSSSISFAQETIIEDDSIAYDSNDSIALAAYSAMFGDETPFPKLGEDKEENARMLQDFLLKQLSRKDINIDALTTCMFVCSTINSVDSAYISITTPLTYRCFYSSYMEYILFKSMGGENKEMGQVFGALRANMTEHFAPFIQKEPEIYCAQADSIISFIRNLDYIGSIYPDVKTFRPASEQEGEVENIVAGWKDIKDGMRQQAKIAAVFRECMNDLHRNTLSIDLQKYFSDNLIELIKAGKKSLCSISPSKKWESWDAGNPKQCSMINIRDNVYIAMLSNKDVNGIDFGNADTTPIAFYVTFEAKDNEWKISSFEEIR